MASSKVSEEKNNESIIDSVKEIQKIMLRAVDILEVLAHHQWELEELSPDSVFASNTCDASLNMIDKLEEFLKKYDDVKILEEISKGSKNPNAVKMNKEVDEYGTTYTRYDKDGKVLRMHFIPNSV